MSEKIKLKPHVYSKLVNELKETSIKYKDTQQLRAQLINTLSKYVEPEHGKLAQ